MSSKSPINWTKLQTEFLSFDGTRAKFFREKGIGKSTWTRHAGPKWDHEQAAHREKIAARTREKIVEKEAETAAQVLQRHAELGKMATALGWNGLFIEKKDRFGNVTKVLREDLHASDMVRLIQLGMNAEHRAKTGLEKLAPPQGSSDPTADNLAAKAQAESELQEQVEVSQVNAELATMREALKDPDKHKAAAAFVKALGFKSE